MSANPVLPPPHTAVAGALKTLVQNPTLVKFAIAYFTKPGAAAAEPILKAVETLDKSFGVVSVEWPTDIAELEKLEHRIPGKLYIHLGAWPKFGRRDVGKLHCKVVYVESADLARVQVGSHNWTRQALDGTNIELGVRYEVARSDGFAKEVSRFLDDVKSLSEPFNPSKSNFYRELQSKMASQPPPPPISPEFGFDRAELTVTHVTLTGGVSLAAGDRVYLELDSNRDPLFPKDRAVHLYSRDSQNDPRLLVGVVTNQNNTQYRTRNADKFREYPESSFMITSWNPPTVARMEVPLQEVRKPPAQGVILLSDPPQGTAYFYHLGSRRPTTTHRVVTEPIESTLSPDELSRVAPALVHSGLTTPRAVRVTTVPRFDRRSTAANRESGYPVETLSRSLALKSQGIDVFVEPSYEDAGETFQTMFVVSSTPLTRESPSEEACDEDAEK